MDSRCLGRPLRTDRGGGSGLRGHMIYVHLHYEMRNNLLLAATNSAAIATLSNVSCFNSPSRISFPASQTFGLDHNKEL